MLRRRHGWDYRAPGWYMITICLADYVHERMGEILDSNRPRTAAAAIPQVGAIPLTGTIPHGDTILEATAILQATAIPETSQVSIVLLPLGQLVDECLREIPANWPGVEIGPYVVMPDHIHCIIHITTRQKHPLGAIVGSFKAKSTARWRELGRKRPGSMDNKQYAAPLKNKGFSERGKPEGALFDRCAAGRLLVMAPSAWPYVPGVKKMTRFDACILNRIAQAIARDGAAEINYHGMRPAHIDGLATAAVG